MKRFRNYLIFAILFFTPLIFFTDLTRNPYYFQIVLLNGLTVILWTAWLIEGLKNRSLAFFRTPVDIALGSFLGAATVSWALAFALNFSNPFLCSSVINEGFKRWLFLVVNEILAFYAAYYFSDDSNRSKFISAALWAGFIASFYGIIQYFGIEPVWPKVLNPFGGRSVSTFGNPTFLSSYIVLLFPVALVNYLAKKARFASLVLLLTFFAGLLCTLTRSSWGGAVVSVAAVVFLLWKFERQFLLKKSRLLVILAAAFLAAVVFWPKSKVEGYHPSVLERLSETAKPNEHFYAPWDQRKLIWSCAWHMVRENPVFGRGWGCFELFYPFYQGRHLFLERYRDFRTHANNAHDEILEIWSQTGTVGFGIYLWLLAIIFRYAYFLIRNLSGEKRLLAIALGASLAGMLADNLLNVSINFPIPGFLYWWNAGLLLGLGAKETKTVNLKNALKKACVWLALIFGIFLIFRYTSDFLAEVHFFRGFKCGRENELNKAVRELEISHKLRRFEVNNNYELANTYVRLDMQDKAVHFYKEALRANAGYDEIYFNMANMFSQAGEKDKAIESYSESLYINPVSKETYAALGGIFLLDMDRYTQAGIKLLEQCALFFPEDKDVWNNLGFLYSQANEQEKAVDAYKKALELDTDFQMARRNYAFSLSKLGKKDDFLPGIDALFARAEKNIAIKNWDQVLRISEKLVGIVPKSFKANLYLGNAYFTLGRTDDALARYNEAIKIEPSNPALLGNMGIAYIKAKNYAMAEEAFNKLLSADPNSALAKQKLDELAHVSGQK